MTTDDDERLEFQPEPEPEFGAGGGDGSGPGDGQSASDDDGPTTGAGAGPSSAPAKITTSRPRRLWLGDLRFWCASFAAGLVLLTIQRVLLFALHAPAPELGGTLADAWPAFFVGLRFDAAALGYPFVLALLVATPIHLLGRKRLARRRPGPRADRLGVLAALGLVVMLATVDLFFFREFRTRLNFVALEYLDDPLASVPLAIEAVGLEAAVFTVGVLGLLLFLALGWVRRAHAWGKGFETAPSWPMRIALVLLFFVAARGGVGRPLRPQDADASPHRFVNQLSLSGPFTLGRHVYELLDNDGAAQTYEVDPRAGLDVARSVFASPGEKFVDDGHPALRDAVAAGEPRRLNVVFVVLESFAARFVGALRVGPEATLTPEFDALADEGVLFTRFLASGPSTNRSLPALVAGVPCVVKRTAIPKSAAGQHELITVGTILRAQGYSTAFLQSGGEGWENLGGWLRSQGFERLVSGEDMDPDLALSYAGPPDHVLLERTLAECDELAASGPFLTMVLTSTNHPPFALPNPLPDDARERVEAVPIGPAAGRERALRYADWALGDFVRTARARPWGKDTLFVLVGDHGVHVAPQAEIDPDRHHVPLLLLGPVPELAARRDERLGSHVDLLPTLLGLLRLPARHAAFGSDLLVGRPGPRYAVLGPHSGTRAYAITSDDGAYLVDVLGGHAALFDLDLRAATLTPRADAEVVARLRGIGRAYLAAAHAALDEGRAGGAPDE